MSTTDYPLVRLWHKETGSMAYYIKAQVERARQTNAPEDALYEKVGPVGRTGEWYCLSDLREAHPFREKALELASERTA